jgi:DNA primase
MRAKALFDAGSEGKAKGLAFLFPYIELLDSQAARASCIEAAADAFGLLPDAAAGDFRHYAQGKDTPERTAADKEVRMNEELSLLVAIALDYVSSGKEKLLSGLRSALELGDIEDRNAKDIFVALEECLRYGEAGLDEFMARIPSPELKKVIVERSVSGEFSINSAQYVNDGIKKIRMKGIQRRQEDIIIKQQKKKKNIREEEQNSEAKELLAEKMQIDGELNQLKQGRLG